MEWGDELHSLQLDEDDWADVKSGKEITIDGEGYHYEGEEYSDTWRFAGGIGGQLRVSYRGGTEECEGEGYIGTLTKDMIETHISQA